MKLIPLSKYGKNKGKYFAQVDDEDYNYLNQWNWCISICIYKKTQVRLIYARRGDYSTGKHKAIKMHRVIMNIKKGEFIDHKDRNGLNNQKSNLRIANRSQNNSNRKSEKGSTSIYLGVWWESAKRNNYSKKRGGYKISHSCGWVSAINTKEKRIYLGRFKTEIEAAKAYDRAAKIHHGEFANLNFKE